MSFRDFAVYTRHIININIQNNKTGINMVLIINICIHKTYYVFFKNNVMDMCYKYMCILGGVLVFLSLNFQNCNDLKKRVKLS